MSQSKKNPEASSRNPEGRQNSKGFFYWIPDSDHWIPFRFTPSREAYFSEERKGL
jgi:hypothetical protein